MVQTLPANQHQLEILLSTYGTEIAIFCLKKKKILPFPTLFLTLHSITCIFCLVVKLFLSILSLDPQSLFSFEIANYSIKGKIVYLTTKCNHNKFLYTKWRNRKQYTVVTSKKHILGINGTFFFAII